MASIDLVRAMYVEQVCAGVEHFTQEPPILTKEDTQRLADLVCAREARLNTAVESEDEDESLTRRTA